MHADEIAQALLDAERAGRSRPSLEAQWPGLTLDAAYEVQAVSLRRRLARGEQLVGLKLGLTSAAKQAQVGVREPITASLTDAMALELGAPVPLGRLIHPRAEPEIAFRMGARLEGPGVTLQSAMAAVDGVCAAVEIIDSRFDSFNFTLPEVVADNASAAGFVVGATEVSPDALDLTLEPCLVEVDGRAVDSATGAAVMGHPGLALAQAANALAERGMAVEAGWTVLTGGMTNAVPLAGLRTMTVRFGALGSIVLRPE